MKKREIKYSQALSEGLLQSMEQDSSVIIMGQSAGVEENAMFGTIQQAAKKYPKRTFEMPLSENGITGWGTGAAIGGLKPVMTHHRNDFLYLALDQIANHAAKWMYMHRTPVPWTIRAIIGRGWGQAPQHSQSLQALFAHIPGLKVIMPSTAYDAKGLLISSINDRSPVIILEHRRLYDQVDHVPEKYYSIPLGKGVILKKGIDVTIVAISQMRLEVELASEALSRAGIEVEIIDPRTILPLDNEIILNSVKKTGRLIICDTGWTSFGVSAEISARISENGFKYLKAPIKRIGMPDCPTPASYELEKFFYPGVADILKAVTEVLPKDKVRQLHDYATTHDDMSKFIGIF